MAIVARAGSHVLSHQHVAATVLYRGEAEEASGLSLDGKDHDEASNRPLRP
jgi:hypothetical protein